ncbi:MAG: DUF4982 domain-containing protein [Bacteroidales bacterium]|jgi:hypothetical protein|nr:DUF4982 domain-containing protein [Bacteroidales bacterium]
MSDTYIIKRSIALTIILAINAVLSLASRAEGRETRDFNFGWKFHKGDIVRGQEPGLDDSGWRNLDLPHDWTIEGPFSRENSSCTGYLPGGIGWYRKSFPVSGEDEDRRFLISFDGVYNNSEVWINGEYLGKRPNGYISFWYDITPYLKFGTNNLIAVKVDHTQDGDSRWYTGSGIYRDVKLITTDWVYVKQWGIYCTTPEVSTEKASLSVNTDIVNGTGKKAKVLVSSILKYRDREIGSAQRKITLEAGAGSLLNQLITVEKPELWDVDDPNLYTLETRIRCGKMSDIVITPVGFRTIRFDADKGFFLNGRNLKLKGICMHHDAGTLGSAVPKEELSRRLDILKEMGSNAIRTSHNPFSSYFMDLCDEKGFLVIGEAFDEWELPKKKWLEGWNAGTPGKQGYAEYFEEWAERDLKDFILRDRNHPSLIMWSIGNEIDYPNDPYTHPILNTEANPQTWAKFSETLPHADRLGEVARKLAAIIRELDKTRPVTAGLASALMSNETGYSDALDVAGYNYQEFRYEADHKKYPARPLYGSENGMTLEMWNYVANNDYVMGQFLWTGIEYLGEAGRFPTRSSTAGVIDLAGNRKPEFYFRQSIWSEKPMVFIGTTDRLTERGPVSLWAHKRVDPVWNYEEGRTISVNAFSNCEEVELFINGRSLGSRKMSDFQNRTITWEIPFEKGTLRAVARNKGTEAAKYEIKTTSTPAVIAAACNETVLKADRKDISHIRVTICDENGSTVYNAANEIMCEVTGPARVIGMEDSNPSNLEDYKDNRQHAFHGKLLVYLQSTGKTGKVEVKLTSPGLSGTTLALSAEE